MRLILDMDDTIVDFLNPLIEAYNKETHNNLTISDITEWDLSKYHGMVDIFKTPGFFRNLKPFPNAVEIIKDLYFSGDFDVVIATDPMGVGTIVEEKFEWLAYYMGFLPNTKVYMCSDKSLIRGDLLFDDNPLHLQSFSGYSVAMDRPYNSGCSVFARIENNDWKKFQQLVKKYLVRGATL